MNAAELKLKATHYGADLIGIAPVERFKGVAAARHPASIFPECKSVLVIGRRILRGSLRGVEEGTNFGSTYRHFGYQWLEDNFLSQTTYDLTCYIESCSFEAVPLFGYSPEGMPSGIPVAEGKPAPNVIIDMQYAAQAAGLGEVGLGGFFLTPQYGPRQRFAAILTDAPLAADALSQQQVCDACGECAGACPFGAIDPHECYRVGVPGAETNVAAVNWTFCRACPNGAALASGRGNRPDRCAALCVRACVVKLEKTGKLANKFQQPFRKRKPWVLDAFRQPCQGQDQSASAAKLGCAASAHLAGEKA